MTSRPSRFPAATKRRQLAQLGSGPVVMIAGSLLFAAAVFFQSPSHSAATTFAGLAAEEAARSSGTVAKIAELEKGFWVCDYIGTTRGTEGSYGVTCGANFEELKQTKFGGDFDALAQWWRLNKVAQRAALESESAGSAQF